MKSFAVKDYSFKSTHTIRIALLFVPRGWCNPPLAFCGYMHLLLCTAFSNHRQPRKFHSIF